MSSRGLDGQGETGPGGRSQSTGPTGAQPQGRHQRSPGERCHQCCLGNLADEPASKDHHHSPQRGTSGTRTQSFEQQHRATGGQQVVQQQEHRPGCPGISDQVKHGCRRVDPAALVLTLQRVTQEPVAEPQRDFSGTPLSGIADLQRDIDSRLVPRLERAVACHRRPVDRGGGQQQQQPAGQPSSRTVLT